MLKCFVEGCGKSIPKVDKEDGMRSILYNCQIRQKRWLMGKWRCDEHNDPDLDEGEESPYLLSPELPEVDVLENSKTENEGHEETNDEPSHLREMHNTRTSDEEWLNEEVYEEVDYQPVRKKPTYSTTKREIQSPPQRPEKYRFQHHNYTKPPPQRVVVNSPKKDDYTVFCEHIGDRLRKFKKPQTRSNLQQLISTILWQAEYGMYDNIENVKRVLLSSIQDMEVVQAVEQPVQEEIIPEGRPDSPN